MNVVIGIDPGAKGAMCVMEAEHRIIVARQNYGVKNGPEKIVKLVRMLSNIVSVVIEDVHSSPQMGVCSAFSFGDNFGWWKGVLDGNFIPFSRVSPQKWMGALGCMTGGDKHVTLRKAAQWFPNAKPTQSDADAILIATYASRVWLAGNRIKGGSDGEGDNRYRL